MSEFSSSFFDNKYQSLINRCFKARRDVESECNKFYNSVGQRLVILQKDDATWMRLITYNNRMQNILSCGRVAVKTETALKNDYLAMRRRVNAHAEIIKRLAENNFLVSREEILIDEVESEEREKLVQEEDSSFQNLVESIRHEYNAVQLLARGHALIRDYQAKEQVFDVEYTNAMNVLARITKGPIIVDSEGHRHKISIDAFEQCMFSKGGFCDDVAEDELQSIELPALTPTFATSAVLEYLETSCFIATASEIDLNRFRSMKDVAAFALKPWEEKFIRKYLFRRESDQEDTFFAILAAAQYFEVQSLVNLCLHRTIRCVSCFEDLKGWCYNHTHQHVLVKKDDIDNHNDEVKVEFYDRFGETKNSNRNPSLLFHQAMQRLVDFFSRIENTKHSMDDAFYGHYQYMWKH